MYLYIYVKNLHVPASVMHLDLKLYRVLKYFDTILALLFETVFCMLCLTSSTAN